MVATVLALGAGTRAQAQTRSLTWPLATDLHVLIGVEPHDRGTPITFGVGAEVLWRASVGGFVQLLSSEGSPIPATSVGGQLQPSLADRISIPFGVAGRPLAPLLPERTGWFGRVLAGLGMQLGATIEHLRTSDASATVVGLHTALTADLPLFGDARRGGLAVRLQARLLFVREVTLDQRAALEPSATGQLLGGLCYYP
jgi:hypothetical protein